MDKIRLSKAEHDIMVLACSGATRPEIAESLGTSPPTVSRRMKAVQDRLGTSNTVQTVVELILECGWSPSKPYVRQTWERN